MSIQWLVYKHQKRYVRHVCSLGEKAMMLKHSCDNCDANYKIIYNEEDCEDTPHFCSVCGNYIIESDTEEDEEY